MPWEDLQAEILTEFCEAQAPILEEIDQAHGARYSQERQFANARQREAWKNIKCNPDRLARRNQKRRERRAKNKERERRQERRRAKKRWDALIQDPEKHEQVKAKNRGWARRNPDKVRANNRKQHARRKRETPEQRERRLAMDRAARAKRMAALRADPEEYELYLMARRAAHQARRGGEKKKPSKRKCNALK